MSDPMTNTEVEDVLASIRRLVSDDNRPAQDSAVPAATDRLVLTPALRVTDTVDEAKAENDSTASNESIDDAEDEALAAQQDDVTEDDVRAFEPVQDTGEDLPGDSAEATDSDVQEAQDVTASIDEMPIALDAVDLDQDTLMSIQDAFDDGDENVGTHDTAEAEPAFGEEATTLSAKIAALETLIAGQTDEFEPESAGDGENGGTEPPALAWEDADEAVDNAPDASPQVEPDADTANTAGAQIFSNDEDVLDEEALRDLVSDIVREELQGALGERITRNVRKLVRREIHRALAAQDLE